MKFLIAGNATLRSRAVFGSTPDIDILNAIEHWINIVTCSTTLGGEFTPNSLFFFFAIMQAFNANKMKNTEIGGVDKALLKIFSTVEEAYAHKSGILELITEDSTAVNNTFLNVLWDRFYVVVKRRIRELEDENASSPLGSLLRVTETLYGYEDTELPRQHFADVDDKE